MAVNKDSQAYKNLLEKWYTDEQIMTMYNEATSGKGKEVVWEEVITMWPLNANLNYYQYWDDSNPAQQWQRWWMNEKYTGEGVKTSNLEYDENITTADLDPNYLYWENARQQNRKEAWYIARRNDNIASALYNEWRVSKEDVANFLSQQNEWMNSTEADRLNTIESVWKRLGQIKPEEVKEEPQADFNKDTSGKIYGKTTAETWEPTDWINTLADDNSVFKAMNQARTNTVTEMYNIWVDNLAAMLYTGSNSFSEQSWRDFRLMYPDTASLVDQKVKELKAQDNVQKIASWDSDYTTAADNVNTNNEATNYAVNATTSSTQATQLLKSIDSILESNDTAKSAQDLMGSIENDMATLKNRLKNLRAEATAAFKWDVPDYIVNAYMNNRTQEIQNQLSILEDRYNAAYTRYKTELSHAEWEAEYKLKKDSLALEEYKAKNPNTSTSTDKNYMRTERNNNPTAMTTDMAKMLWWELWVDYEIWDAFTTSSWTTLYTAKLIWDPIETTIRLIDRWIANGIDPFYRANWQPRWSYLSSIWITKDKWSKMNDEQKAEVIAKMLQHEWGSMENMSYYLNNATSSSKANKTWTEDDYKNFETFLAPNTNQTTIKAIAMKYWFEDNIAWMTDFAREQLNNRPWATKNNSSSVSSSSEKVVVTKDDWTTATYAYWVTEDDPSINQPWFDPELWYFPSKAKAYQTLLDDNKKFNEASEQMQQEAINYWNRQSLWWNITTWNISVETEKDVPEWWSYNWDNDDFTDFYRMSSKELSSLSNDYRNSIINHFGSIEEFMRRRSLYINEVMKKEWQKESENVLKSIAQLYNMTEDDNWKLDFWPWFFWYIWLRSSKDKFKQIVEQLKLAKLIEARDNGATFGSMTEWEWRIIENAASSLHRWRPDSAIDKEMKSIVSALWNATYWEELTESKWNEFKKEQKRLDELAWNLSANDSWPTNNAPLKKSSQWTNKESSKDW